MDFQGGFVARLTPDSLTVGDNMNMMGCCPPEAMRALAVVWRSVVTESKDGVWVNLGFDRDAPEARVVSFAPSTGRLTVVAKKAASFFAPPVLGGEGSDSALIGKVASQNGMDRRLRDVRKRRAWPGSDDRSTICCRASGKR